MAMWRFSIIIIRITDSKMEELCVKLMLNLNRTAKCLNLIGHGQAILLLKRPSWSLFFLHGGVTGKKKPADRRRVFILLLIR